MPGNKFEDRFYDPKQAPPNFEGRFKEEPSRLAAAGRGFETGISFGLNDEVRAGYKRFMQDFKEDPQKEFNDKINQARAMGRQDLIPELAKARDLARNKSFEELQKDEIAALDKLREAHPGWFGVGEVAGALATTPLLPGGSVARGAGLGAKVLAGTKAGAAYGALRGAGEGEGLDLGNRAVNAVKGGATGAVVGAVAPAVTHGAGRLAGMSAEKATQLLKFLRDRTGLQDSTLLRYLELGGSREGYGKSLEKLVDEFELHPDKLKEIGVRSEAQKLVDAAREMRVPKGPSKLAGKSIYEAGRRSDKAMRNAAGEVEEELIQDANTIGGFADDIGDPALAQEAAEVAGKADVAGDIRKLLVGKPARRTTGREISGDALLSSLGFLGLGPKGLLIGAGKWATREAFQSYKYRLGARLADGLSDESLSVIDKYANVLANAVDSDPKQLAVIQHVLAKEDPRFKKLQEELKSILGSEEPDKYESRFRK